jgi:DNA-binding SARP family transcriptional activator/tetratricopeptide (TPR) repeat protein
MPLEFRVLGPLEVRRDGAVLPLGGKRVRALLAVLLIDMGRVVSADALIEALWPSDPPTNARHALEATATRLRRALGTKGAVPNQPPGYLLAVDPQALDAVRFRRLLAEADDLVDADARRAAVRADDALALWRGEPYAEFAFEAFARDEIAELVELRLHAEELRIDAALADGRAEELVGEIAALVAAEPTREHRREQLMLALYAAGRQADALAAFREARTFLQEELGLEPSEPLRELERAIFRQDPELAARPRASVARPRARRPASALVVEPAIPLDLDPEEHERRTARAAAFVTRVADHYGARLVAPFAMVFLDENHAATAAAAARELAQSVSGRTGIATGEVLVDDERVGGPLLEVARRNLGEAAQPTQPFERRQDAPFVGRRDELERLRGERATLVLGPPGIGKSRLLRELALEHRVVVGRCSTYAQEALAPLREIARELDAPDTLASTPASDIPIVFRRLCRAAAPVTIALDDLHWAYPIVLDTVEHLVEHAEDGVRVVCLAREELLEERPTIAPSAQRLLLDPLRHDDAVALALALGADDVSVVERAEGNPLFIEQLLAHADEGSDALPSTLHALLVSRLDRLAPTERSAIDCAAVAGREFDAALVAGLLRVGSARAALDSLVRRGLLEPGRTAAAFEERYRFRHPLIHDAAYTSIPNTELTRLHETVADACDERDAGDEVVGFHLERAAQLRPEDDRHGRRLAEEAGARLGSAGIAAGKRGDAGTETRLLERATALLPEAELLCELGVGLDALGRSTDADVALEAAAASTERRIRLRARLELAARAALGGSAAPDDVLAIAGEAIPIFEALEDERSLGRAWMLSGWIRGGALVQNADWQDAAERALAHYQRAGWRASTCIGHIAAALYHGPTAAPTAIERCHALLEEAVDDLPAEAAVATHLGGLYAMTGDFGMARPLLERGRFLYTELGRKPALRRTCNVIEAAVGRLRGELDAVAELLEASCAELLATGDIFHLASQAAELADVLVELGRLDAAELWLRRADEHRHPRDVEGSIFVLRTRARLDGDLNLAQEAAQLADATDALNLSASVQVALADLLKRGGRRADATRALRTARDLYRRKGNAAAEARLGRRSSAAAR